MAQDWDFEDLFAKRRAIARIGEGDWMRWWDSNALNDAGDILIPRLFRRTPHLSAAHMAMLAARARHDSAVPREPLIHLFNLGEVLEGAFERWLIQRKSEGWSPPPMPPGDTSLGAGEALKALGLEPETDSGSIEGSHLVLGDLEQATIDERAVRESVLRSLAGAYALGERGRLVVPYYRLKG